MTPENQDPMKVEPELPDELVEELCRESNARGIPPGTCVSELVYRRFAGKSLLHEVEAWHHSRLD